MLSQLGLAIPGSVFRGSFVNLNPGIKKSHFGQFSAQIYKLMDYFSIHIVRSSLLSIDSYQIAQNYSKMAENKLEFWKKIYHLNPDPGIDIIRDFGNPSPSPSRQTSLAGHQNEDEQLDHHHSLSTRE